MNCGASTTRVAGPPPDPCTTQAWKDALTRNNNLVYDAARQAFPSTFIEWYDRGAEFRWPDASGWAMHAYCTMAEKGDSVGVSLYTVPEIGMARASYNKTAALAVDETVISLTPPVYPY